ncbi:triacylglycerol lipase OBL1-like isoform X1 [Arachis duranensis]|uniref:Triacylglycerol lipase OBL1-like isoform X1 n=1 Tax=Arachis duranensis TaxID=130453 RepID=A0A9C6U050_ARADU|nr:triacylglycerol lipase OBL1-like isoform X1 [Arachis duranensis]
MSCKELFGGTYLLLNPQEATLLDLLRLLFSSKLENRSFIECPVDIKAEEFRQRWLLFTSIVAQKLLFTSGNTMKMMGDNLELWLNTLSSNGGFLGLFKNKLKGKVITPDASSATFMSVAGFLDYRVDLVKSIQDKNDDAKYKALLSMMASKFSYENEEYIENAVTNRWHMKFWGLYSFWNDTYVLDFQELWSTKAIILQDTKTKPNLIVVAFRGTQPFNSAQWITDVDLSWYELPNVGKIHSGFMKALGLQKNSGWPKEIDQTSKSNHLYAYYTIREELKAMLHANEDAKFIVTGHSLGGALAILFAAILTLHEEAWLLDKLEGVYTFGQPRVGDQAFGDFMKESMRKYDVKYRRYVYCNDLVPRIPYEDKTLFFKHFGPSLYFNSLYQGQVLEEEPNKNYFSVLWVIPKILNAVWELVRGFFLPLVKGKEYKDTWLMTLARFVGLIIPGVSAHLPPDYVNVTRLGSLREIQDLSVSETSKTD